MWRRLTATVLSFFTIGASAVGAGRAVGAVAQDRVATPTGDIVITPLAHASLQIAFGSHVIQVDPWSMADLAHARPADLVLITDADAGAHHLDAAAIAKVRKHEAPIVIPASGRSKVRRSAMTKSRASTRRAANARPASGTATTIQPNIARIVRGAFPRGKREGASSAPSGAAQPTL